MFTFVVIIYNEENTILHLLESIKYQIVKYGQEKDFQLILADDASEDRSCEVMNGWISQNLSLFVDIRKQYASQNRGTCKSLSEAFRKMEGEAFYLVAGDDIIVKKNMFEKYKLLEKYDIIANGVLTFSDNHIQRNRKKYLNVALQCIYTEKYLKNAVKLGCPILNGAIIRKELLTEDVLNLMEQYVLLDDRPRYYQIFKENKNIKYFYDNSPILLYRESKHSVSNFKSRYKGILDADMDKLYEKIKNETPSIIGRIKILFQQRALHHRGKGGVFQISRYFTPYYISLMILILMNRKEIIQCENDLIQKYADENEKHILDIMNRVQ